MLMWKTYSCPFPLFFFFINFIFFFLIKFLGILQIFWMLIFFFFQVYASIIIPLNVWLFRLFIMKHFKHIQKQRGMCINNNFQVYASIIIFLNLWLFRLFTMRYFKHIRKQRDQHSEPGYPLPSYNSINFINIWQLLFHLYIYPQSNPYSSSKSQLSHNITVAYFSLCWWFF